MERIASERNLNIGTVTGHLIKLFEQDFDINLRTLIHRSCLESLLEFYAKNSNIETAKEVFKHFARTYEYHEIKIAEAVFKQE